MNILIKLTCLIGLVIAPILGGHSATTEKGACCSGDKKEMVCSEGKCDLSKCATMTKDECAKMCEANGCSDECKEKCMSQYDENGKYIGDAAHVHGPNCNHDKAEIKDIKVTKVKDANGKVKATVILTTMVDGKETTEEKVFEGDDLEVDAKIAELGK